MYMYMFYFAECGLGEDRVFILTPIDIIVAQVCIVHAHTYVRTYTCTCMYACVYIIHNCVLIIQIPCVSLLLMFKHGLDYSLIQFCNLIGQSQ